MQLREWAHQQSANIRLPSLYTLHHSHDKLFQALSCFSVWQGGPGNKARLYMQCLQCAETVGMETAQSIVTLWFIEGVCIYTDGEQLASCLPSKPSGSVMILQAKLIAFQGHTLFT